MHDDQILVTFHAGMEAVAYEWGSLNHVSPKDNSPDNNAHNDIGARLVAFAGSATPAEGSGPHKLYPVGKMNSVVYPVDGGLEVSSYSIDFSTPDIFDIFCIAHVSNLAYRQDWAYSAGWDSGPMRKCDNTVGINAKADRDNSTGTGTNAALVFLVETSDDKKPKDDALGGPCQVGRGEWASHMSPFLSGWGGKDGHSEPCAEPHYHSTNYYLISCCCAVCHVLGLVDLKRQIEV